jgi:hypothetical protein
LSFLFSFLASFAFALLSSSSSPEFGEPDASDLTEAALAASLFALFLSSTTSVAPVNE